MIKCSSLRGREGGKVLSSGETSGEGRQKQGYDFGGEIGGECVDAQIRAGDGTG